MSQVVSFDDIIPAARFDNVPWSGAIPEEGASQSGPWITLTTIELAPLDADPTDPQARSLTIVDASDDPDLWYRFTFTDDDGGMGQPTAAIQSITSAEAAAGQFVTSEDLAVRLGLEFTAEEADRADTLLTAATGLIQDETRQTVFLVEDDTLTMPGRNDERITLPEKPVVSIASVTIDGRPLVEGTSWYLDGNTIVRLSGTELIAWLPDDAWPSSCGFGTPRQTLEIVYTHGYEDIPLLVKSITLEAAARVWVNPGAVISDRVGDTFTTYAPYAQPPRGLLLTDEEKKQLRRFFGDRSRGVTIGG